VMIVVALVGPPTAARHRIRDKNTFPTRMQTGRLIPRPPPAAEITTRDPSLTRSRMQDQVESARYGNHELARSIVDMAVRTQEEMRMLVGPALEETREYTGMRRTWTNTLRTDNRAVRSSVANWRMLGRRVGNKTGLLRHTRNDHTGGRRTEKEKDTITLNTKHHPTRQL
jgi:hypothetical protein